jgi:N6-L-threonylcarbamoyladenine synthase/protein kinase Bud32
MFAAGDTVAIADSAVDPDFRPDQVPVTWRAGESVARRGAEADVVRGAEATVEIDRAAGRVLKRRLPKGYRHPDLDDRLRRERTVAEARLLSEARRHGVPTPLVLDVDLAEGVLTVQYVGDADLATALSPARCRAVGAHLATLHAAGIVHGDPTPRNVRVAPELASVAPRAIDGETAGGVDRDEAASAPDPDADPGRVFFIDFGLGSHTGHVEDHAMDLHVLEGSLSGTADDPDPLVAAVEAGYRAAGADAAGPSDQWTAAAVLDRLREVEGRGRYQ